MIEWITHPMGRFCPVVSKARLLGVARVICARIPLSSVSYYASRFLSPFPQKLLFSRREFPAMNRVMVLTIVIQIPMIV